MRRSRLKKICGLFVLVLLVVPALPSIAGSSLTSPETKYSIQQQEAASPFEIRASFNELEPGSPATGKDGFHGTAGGSIVSNERVFEGNGAAMLRARGFSENFGYFGGRFDIPFQYKGTRIWIRVRTWFPESFDYTAQPRLKFLRLHTRAAPRINKGYNDIYINRPGSETPFIAIKEMQHVIYPMGLWRDEIVPETWETYEMFVHLDDQSQLNGGDGVIRFYKNGKMLGEFADAQTLHSATDFVDLFYLFTYWNGDPYTRAIFAEGATKGDFEAGEPVAANGIDEGFVVRTINSNGSLDIYHTKRRKIPKFKPGSILRGLNSGAELSVKEVRHHMPKKDQHMYVDDIVITNIEPSQRDKYGNPVIGLQ